MSKHEMPFDEEILAQELEHIQHSRDLRDLTPGDCMRILVTGGCAATAIFDLLVKPDLIKPDLISYGMLAIAGLGFISLVKSAFDRWYYKY